MSFTPHRRPGQIMRLPILHPDDKRVPQWVRERYAGRRCVIWTEDYAGAEGSIVAGGPEPVSHPGEEPTHPIEPPPRAVFTFAPERPLAGEEVTFDASASTPAELTDRYVWNAPIDAEPVEGKVITATFTAGIRYVLLTVHTVDGRQHTAAQIVDVAAPPTARFTWSPQPGRTFEPIEFDASASTPGTGGPIVAYEWDWGDDTDEQ